MTRRSILSIVVTMATAASFDPSAFGSDAGRAEDRVLSAGRVIKVDANGGKITIEHKPIQHLYMESMIMIFRVTDPGMLIGLTPGNKIRFKVERDGEGFVVTRIENSN